MLIAKIILSMSIFWTALSLVVLYVCAINHDYDEGTAAWVVILLVAISVLIGSAVYLGAS